MTRAVWVLAVVVMSVAAVPAQAGKPTEAEKAKKAAEKKLDAFEKTYDPSKDLSRKNPEKLDKDIAELDEVLEALKAADPAAATELTARRESLVTKAKEGVSSASAGKADEEFTKRFTKAQESVDPEKKRLENLDAATIKRMKDELDRVIAKFDEGARKPYEEKRDALFAKLEQDIAKAKLGKSRAEVGPKVPDVKPEAGVERIAPMKPSWCDGVETALAKVYSNYHVGGVQLGDDTALPRALSMAVTFSCYDPDFELRQQWVALFRQQVSNRYGISAAANERLMKLAAKMVIAGDADAQQKATCEQFASPKEGTREAKFSRGLERFGLGCAGRLIDQVEGLPLNSIDVPNGLSSQLAGAVLAGYMTTTGFHSEDGKLTGFAVANAVIRFDAAKFESELTEWKLNEVGTINAVATFYGMQQSMKALEAAARARNAAVLIDAPKKGAAAFIAALANSQSAINVALALEEQQRAGTLKGCGAKLYPDVVAAVKGQKAPLEDLRIDGLLAYKLTLCGRGDAEAPVMERVFGYYAQHSVPVRGPFTAAYLSLLEAHNAAGGGATGRGSFDPNAKRGAAPSEGKGPFVPDSNPIDPPDVDASNSINPGTLPAGIVKAVEKQGELTKIVFRTEHYMVPVLECHETNKIDRIASDGTILYRSSCKVVGEREETATNEPITVPTYASHGVGPGSFLLYASAPVNDDVKGQPHRGWVVEAYESKARKNRTSLFGIAQ